MKFLPIIGMLSTCLSHSHMQVVALIVEDVAAGTAPTLQLVSRSRRNVVYNPAQVQPAAVASGSAAEGVPEMTLGLRDRLQTRCMVSNQAAGAVSFARSE